jgi:hypothetical protein
VLVGVVPPTPLPLTCEFFLTNIVTLQARHCTALDIAEAAEKAAAEPTILLFSQVAQADADVQARIAELVAGTWRPVDLMPRFGVVQPQIGRINKDSVVLAVSGAVFHA